MFYLLIICYQFHGTTFKLDHPRLVLISLISIGSVVKIGDNCIQNFNWGGILSDIRLEI